MGGGNSTMSLRNEVTTNLENSVKNHVSLVNDTSSSVTQSYVDQMKSVSKTNTTINQDVLVENTRITSGGEVNITQKAEITAALLAQNRISNETTDRTSLESIMQSALDQAVSSQAENDTSQKAVNVMEQLDQNNGGPDGVAGKLADTVNKLAGGGDSHQNVPMNMSWVTI